MKEIYVLSVQYEYEGSNVIGAFTTPNNTLKGMRDYISSNSFYDGFVIEKVYPNQVYDEVSEFKTYDP